MLQVKENNTVKVHYIGKLTTGEVFDSSENREPLQFTVGSGQVIPGFEQGVLGMEVNEKKTVEIPPAQAYGEKREDLIFDVPRAKLPEGMEPAAGMELFAQNEDGSRTPLTILSVDADSVKLDANHKLAGQTLIFDITLVEIS